MAIPALNNPSIGSTGHETGLVSIRFKQAKTKNANLVSLKITPYAWDNSDNLLWGAIAGVASTLSGAGYAVGCLLVNSNATTGIRTQWENVGTTTSCNFILLDNPLISVTNLTAAQLIALATAGVALTPTPASTGIAVLEECIFNFITGSTGFTSGGIVTIGYGNLASAPLAIAPSIPAATVNATASSLSEVKPLSASVITPVLQTPLYITASAAFATGTGTAKVTTRYRFVTP